MPSVSLRAFPAHVGHNNEWQLSVAVQDWRIPGGRAGAAGHSEIRQGALAGRCSVLAMTTACLLPS